MYRAVLVSLLAAGVAGVLPATAQAAKPALSVSDVAVSESAASAVVEFKLSKKAKRKVKAAWSTADGSARAGADYTASSGKIKIKARRRKARVEIPLIGDSSDESDETFEVRIDSVKRAKIGDGTGLVTIADDDEEDEEEPPEQPSPPTISISPGSVPEGTEGTHPHTFTATLSSASAQPVSVGYSTPSGGTALQGTDYIATAGELSFAPGEIEQTFDVSTFGDYDDESDETFPIMLSDPVNVTLPATAPSVTITDDDPPCTTAGVPASATALGSVSGDTGFAPVVQQSSEISPCLDTDWYRFTLTEDSDSDVDLLGAIALQTTNHDSPGQGNLTLCAQIGVGGAPVCSASAAGLDEGIDLCVGDTFGSDNSTEFYIEVKGTGNAVNDYDLSVFGNILGGSAAEINIGC
jgi:hypothetical protein